jgi:hypothetical protein
MDEVFKRLNRIAKEMMEERGERVTIRAALLEMIKPDAVKPTDLAWSWRFRKSNFRRKSRNNGKTDSSD